jgi:hypothetical protein
LLIAGIGFTERPLEAEIAIAKEYEPTAVPLCAAFCRSAQQLRTVVSNEPK